MNLWNKAIYTIVLSLMQFLQFLYSFSWLFISYQEMNNKYFSFQDNLILWTQNVFFFFFLKQDHGNICKDCIYMYIHPLSTFFMHSRKTEHLTQFDKKYRTKYPSFDMMLFCTINHTCPLNSLHKSQHPKLLIYDCMYKMFDY